VTFPRYPGVSVKKATTTIALDPERLGDKLQRSSR
jgi:hypothetical protein